jgi:peroxiredoxin
MSGDGGGLGLGDALPAFSLPDTEGETHTLGEPSPDVAATVVYWTCNHCPYALAWHDRLLEVASDYEQRGVRVLAINSNDPERYPADSPQAMADRVRSEGGWPHPYLFDGSQQVARAFGAERTPQVFLADSELRLRYRGAPDADYEDPAQNASWLRGALDAVLAGRGPDPPETEAVGCSIKWR